MEYGKSNDSADELEVVEMLRINPRMRVDLKRVVIVSGIFKQAIEGVEHFVRKEEEELSALN